MFVTQLIHNVMRNVSRFTFCAILFALFLIQPVLGDIIPTKVLGMMNIIVPLTQTVLQLHQSKETSFP